MICTKSTIRPALAAMLVVGVSVCGHFHVRSTLAAEVFTFGANDFGATGLGLTSGDTVIATPILTTNLGGKSIVQASGEGRHSLLLASDGSVFAFGFNNAAQNGFGFTGGEHPIAQPIAMASLSGKTIVEVSTGYQHSLLLADDGSVFAFGGNDGGQTGIGVSAGQTLIATPIDTSNLGGRPIKHVVAGINFSLILAQDGTVYSFGSNVAGKGGLGFDGGSVLIATPIDATNLAGKSIVQMAAGEFHSLLLADDGTVFAFGSNSSGQTGLGLSSGSTLLPTPIDTTNLVGKSIVQVAAGYHHSLLLADDGTVFSFGSNGRGRTGLVADSAYTLVATPIDMSNLDGQTVVQIAAGADHNLLLTSEGTVFSFGWDLDGETGQGRSTGDTLIASPIITTNLAGRRVIGIAAGTVHSFLLAVPEPGTAALLLSGVLVLALQRRRRIGAAGLAAVSRHSVNT